MITNYPDVKHLGLALTSTLKNIKINNNLNIVHLSTNPKTDKYGKILMCQDQGLINLKAH